MSQSQGTLLLSFISTSARWHKFLSVRYLCDDQTTKRAGWVRRGVHDPESVADHMYRMGLMALIASDIPGINRDKLEFLVSFSSYCLFILFFFLSFPL